MAVPSLGVRQPEAWEWLGRSTEALLDSAVSPTSGSAYAIRTGLEAAVACLLRIRTPDEQSADEGRSRSSAARNLGAARIPSGDAR